MERWTASRSAIACRAGTRREVRAVSARGSPSAPCCATPPSSPSPPTPWPASAASRRLITMMASMIAIGADQQRDVQTTATLSRSRLAAGLDRSRRRRAMGRSADHGAHPRPQRRDQDDKPARHIRQPGLLSAAPPPTASSAVCRARRHKARCASSPACPGRTSIADTCGRPGRASAGLSDTEVIVRALEHVRHADRCRRCGQYSDQADIRRRDKSDRRPCSARAICRTSGPCKKRSSIGRH